jgi:hypothetical protein
MVAGIIVLLLAVVAGAVTGIVFLIRWLTH